MNKKERIGFEYLLSLGYRKNQIKFNIDSSPDFITKDGKGWEVKPDKYYQFTDRQLYDMDFNTRIIFVDEKGGNVTSIKYFYEILSEFFNGVLYCEEINGVNIICGFPQCFLRNDIYTIIFPFAEDINKRSRLLPFTDDEKKEIQEWIGGWK